MYKIISGNELFFSTLAYVARGYIMASYHVGFNEEKPGRALIAVCPGSEE